MNIGACKELNKKLCCLRCGHSVETLDLPNLDKYIVTSYYSVFGKRESLQRFVIEDGAKPAIFGSYSYDPVKQVFVLPPADNVTGHEDGPSSAIPDQQSVNGSYFSTAIGDIAEPGTPTDHTEVTEHMAPQKNETGPVFRKHVTVQPLRKNTAWWIRPKFPISAKNLTSSLHKLNKL